MNQSAFVRERCAVTAFDMHFEVNHDGSERGLWFWLRDQSKDYQDQRRKWLVQATEEFLKMMKEHPPMEGAERFTAWLRLSDTVGAMLAGKVNEAALLEWPVVKALHEKLGAVIRAHEEKEGPVKGRTPRKPDRRSKDRRRDDKRKARLGR